MVESPRLGICLVGCGQIARSHMQAINELSDRIQLVSAVDSDHARAQAFAETHGAVHHGSNYDEAFARDDVHAAILCLPHDLHAPVTTAAARQGVHVLCEKPMALDTSEAEQMANAAADNKVRLMIGHNRRFIPSSLRAREIISTGTLGPIRHVSASILSHIEAPSTSWRKSAAKTGGFLIPLFGTHLIDLLLWVTGLKATRVSCESASGHATWEGEDEVAIIIALRENLEATVPATVLMSTNCRMGTGERPSSRDEMIIAGTDGTLHWQRNSLLLNGNPVDLDSEKPSSFRAQLEEFAAAVREEREPISSGREGVQVMRVLDACHESSRSRSTVCL